MILTLIILLPLVGALLAALPPSNARNADAWLAKLVAVGRDALNAKYFPLRQPTMNFGRVRDDSDPVEDRAVVLHEFGHALGCIHEHQSPTFDRKWNKKAVLEYFKGPPNYWSEDEIESKVLASPDFSPIVRRRLSQARRRATSSARHAPVAVPRGWV